MAIAAPIGSSAQAFSPEYDAAMVRDELSALSAFLAVAEERSFTRAARRLGVSPSALSHAIRGLEDRLGVHLLARTTRSVAPTVAGEQFLKKLGPALTEVRGALQQVADFRDRPAGRVRLVASRLAARMVLAAVRTPSPGLPELRLDLAPMISASSPGRETGRISRS